jgi:hypothetical protein
MDIENIPISFRGIDSPLSEQIEACLRQLLVESETIQHLDLSLLDGVTVAADFEECVRTFDKGYVSNEIETMRETIVGKMLILLRLGEIRGHVVLPAYVAVDLLDKDCADYMMSKYTFIHECAHVHELGNRVKTMGEQVLNYPIAQSLATALQVSWNEYAVCRLAASSYPDLIGRFRRGCTLRFLIYWVLRPEFRLYGVHLNRRYNRPL